MTAPRLLRTSERTTFKRCRWKWWQSYEKGLRSPNPKGYLRFGDLVHQALAAYYKPGKKRGPHPARTFKKLYDEETEEAGKFGIKDLDDEWYDAGDLGIDMLEHYIDSYGSDFDLEVIAPEMPFKVGVRDLGGKPFWYVGRFDAVVRWRSTGRVGLLEHKTAKTLSDSHLILDEQASSYWLFAPWWLRKLGIMEEVENLDMILYNMLRKGKRDTRPQDPAGHYLNQDGSVSKVQPSPFFARIPVFRDEDDAKQTLHRIRAEAFEMRMIREGKLPIYKNPTRDCSWDCPLRDMCELHEAGSDWKEFARHTLQVIDPYDDYKTDLKIGG